MEPTRINKPAMYAVGLFVLLAIILFGFIVTKNQGNELAEEVMTNEPAEQVSDTAMIVTAKHDYVDGKHIYAGNLDLPTPCHILRHDVVFLDEENMNAEIQFTSSVDDPESVCAQVINTVPFKVEFEAPEDAAISATLNGEGIVLNAVPVPDGEDIDSFSEFIKG